MAADDVRIPRGEPMRCPSCGARLVEVERSDVLIDACPECRGVWLDRGELDKILAKERAASAKDPDQDFFDEVEGRRREREPAAYDDHRSSHDYDYGHGHGHGHGGRRRGGLLGDLLDFD